MRWTLVIVALLLGIIGHSGYWVMDVSNVVLSGGGTHVTNGWWTWDAVITHHVGMYVTLVALWTLAALLVAVPLRRG